MPDLISYTRDIKRLCKEIPQNLLNLVNRLEKSAVQFQADRLTQQLHLEKQTIGATAISHHSLDPAERPGTDFDANPHLQIWIRVKRCA